MDKESTAIAQSGKGPDARAVRRGSPSGLDERKDECAPARPIPSAWGRRKTSPLRDAGPIRDSPASSDRPDGRPRPAKARRRHRRHPGTESRGNRREHLSSQWTPSCHPAGSTVRLGRMPRQCREASRLHTGHAPPTLMSGSEGAGSARLAATEPQLDRRPRQRPNGGSRRRLAFRTRPAPVQDNFFHCLKCARSSRRHRGPCHAQNRYLSFPPGAGPVRSIDGQAVEIKPFAFDVIAR